VTPLFVASVEQVVEELLLQVYVHRLRAGDGEGARRRAERALERMLSRGLPSARGPNGNLLLDPYLSCNSLKARAGEPFDEAWDDWVEAARCNATSLPIAPHRYRVNLTRTWRLPPLPKDRPVVLRLPLPRRGAVRGTPEARLVEPEGAFIERRDEEGRVELRLDAARVRGVACAELSVEFIGGEQLEAAAEEAASGVDLWLKPIEGLIGPSRTLEALASELPGGSQAPRQFAYAAFDHLMAVLRLGDLHRDHLSATDPLGSLLSSAWVDCALAATVFTALCRMRGIAARVVSGFLLHRAFPAPHFWAEARLEEGRWVPFDLGGWDYCRGDPHDPAWGHFFCGRVDARFLAEVGPRNFTGWGSARPPPRWFRLFALRGDGVEHTLHALPDGELFQGDRIALTVLGPEV
jgi:hypothetical protein